MNEKLRQNPTRFAVVSDIPIQWECSWAHKYPFAYMEVGESFTVTEQDGHNASTGVRGSCYYWSQKGKKFIARYIRVRGRVVGTRVWRVR